MPEHVPQTYKNHSRYIPMFHFVTGGILLLNLLWAFVRIYHAMRGGGRFDRVNSVVGLLVAIALVLLFLYTRQFVTVLQDRIIRIEMEHRLHDVLPLDLRSRIGELSVGQLIALRFAGDAELPDLTRKVLDEKIANRDAIKRQIREWKADDLRV
jgi:Family of unknown function (DUF6526)